MHCDKQTLCKNLKTFGQGKQKFEHGDQSVSQFWSIKGINKLVKNMFNKFQRICIDITEGIELPEKLLSTFFVCGKNEKSGLVQNRTWPAFYGS